MVSAPAGTVVSDEAPPSDSNGDPVEAGLERIEAALGSASQALERARSDLPASPEVERFLAFVESSERGVPA